MVQPNFACYMPAMRSASARWSCMPPTAALAHGMSSSDFEPAPTDPLHLILLLKDLRHFLGSGNE